MTESSPDRCEYLWPEDFDCDDDPYPDHQSCCWRKPWREYDRCIWHVETDEEKPAEELERYRETTANRELNRGSETPAELLDGAHLAEADLTDVRSFTGCTFRDAYLRKATLIGADFRKATLTGAYLSDADLTNAILQHTDLTNANPRGATFTDADLRSADLTNANLRGADLRKADLWKADFTDTNLGHAKLTNAKLQYATLTDASLQWADLIDAILRNVKLTGANLLSADLTGASLWNADLTGASLWNASLTGASLWNASLTDTKLREATLTNANLRDATLTNANLLYADLTDANLRDATLTNANLLHADLTNADLRDADLVDANLNSTNLSQANTENGSLSGSDLDRTNLTDAKLHNCRLQDVYISDDTTFGTRCAYERTIDPYDIQAGQLAAVWYRFRYWIDGLSDRSPDTDDTEDIEKAISVYRTYQRLHRENALPEDIPKYYYREKEMRRIKALAKGNTLTWFYRALQRWVMGYGERPWRVVGTSLLVIIGFGLVYPYFGGMEATDTETVTFRFVESVPLLAETGWARTVFENLYFSAVTFTTLGYGDIQPGSDIVQLLASIESFLGALLMALLVAVLTRRTMR